MKQTLSLVLITAASAANSETQKLMESIQSNNVLCEAEMKTIFSQMPGRL
jgi:hypothetical protein